MAHTSNNTTGLVKIGKEGFDAIDDHFRRGGQYSKQHVSRYHQYRPQKAYHVVQQVYAAPVAATVTERVITCEDAAKMYGGTLFVEYPKRNLARKGFFL